MLHRVHVKGFDSAVKSVLEELLADRAIVKPVVAGCDEVPLAHFPSEHGVLMGGVLPRVFITAIAWVYASVTQLVPWAARTLVCPGEVVRLVISAVCSLTIEIHDESKPTCLAVDAPGV